MAMKLRSLSKKLPIEIKDISIVQQKITYKYFQSEDTRKYILNGVKFEHILYLLRRNGFEKRGDMLYFKKVGGKNVFVAAPKFIYVACGNGKKTVMPDVSVTNLMVDELEQADVFIVYAGYMFGHVRNVQGKSRENTPINVQRNVNKNLPYHCGVGVFTKDGGVYYDLLNNRQTCKPLRKLKTGQNVCVRTKWSLMFQKYVQKRLVDRGLLPSDLKILHEIAPYSLCEPNACGLLALTIIQMIVDYDINTFWKLEQLKPMSNWNNFLIISKQVLETLSETNCYPIFKLEHSKRITFQGQILLFENNKIKANEGSPANIVRMLANAATCSVIICRNTKSSEDAASITTREAPNPEIPGPCSVESQEEIQNASNPKAPTQSECDAPGNVALADKQNERIRDKGNPASKDGSPLSDALVENCDIRPIVSVVGSDLEVVGEVLQNAIFEVERSVSTRRELSSSENTKLDAESSVPQADKDNENLPINEADNDDEGIAVGVKAYQGVVVGGKEVVETGSNCNNEMSVLMLSPTQDNQTGSEDVDITSNRPSPQSDGKTHSANSTGKQPRKRKSYRGIAKKSPAVAVREYNDANKDAAKSTFRCSAKRPRR